MTTEQDWTQDFTSVVHALVLARQAIMQEIKTSAEGRSQSLARPLAEALQKRDPDFQILPHKHVPSQCYLTRGAL